MGPTLRADVGPPDLPAASATAGDVWAFADATVGQLDIANRFKRASLETIEACEARDAAAARAIARPWWKLWG